ncbi:hypothetical protein HJG60_011952 [Phyllostomus discolor]|uniref:Uncharacterized protein n=1 Tax=Phyllostomus discolor TaxID=89673 RepID=A0A833ZJB9_9CHIR|nr:hypothetical protein HJG60_011952 [Phyllostomus discolor]
MSEADGTRSELPFFWLECDSNSSGGRIGPSPSNLHLSLVLLGPLYRGSEPDGPVPAKASPCLMGLWVICRVTRVLILCSIEATRGVRTAEVSVQGKLQARPELSLFVAHFPRGPPGTLIQHFTPCSRYC